MFTLNTAETKEKADGQDQPSVENEVNGLDVLRYSTISLTQQIEHRFCYTRPHQPSPQPSTLSGTRPMGRGG